MIGKIVTFVTAAAFCELSHVASRPSYCFSPSNSGYKAAELVVSRVVDNYLHWSVYNHFFASEKERGSITVSDFAGFAGVEIVQRILPPEIIHIKNIAGVSALEFLSFSTFKTLYQKAEDMFGLAGNVEEMHEEF